MTGMYGISAYKQTNKNVKLEKSKTSSVKSEKTSKKDQTSSLSESVSSKVETKKWSPLDEKSSLIPKNTEYGTTIGEVALSDKAKDYYEKLKSKFGNMEFIAVSKDMKDKVQQNAAAYGNSSKMVVLIDEEKLERMANDESYRKKYEGIISMSQTKLEEAKNSLFSSGASIKNFGISVDSNGNEKLFATVEKSQELQKKRIEKKAEEKREQKIKDKKQAEKKAKEERLEEAKEKRLKEKSYETIEADSMEELINKVQIYSSNNAMQRVKSESERMVGTNVDFKG
ncbi:MAG: DUF6033 family protein [Lachnospiraceae bacterium]|nr:DUF6033 family protein [Lachnospiraceae bacterium]